MKKFMLSVVALFAIVSVTEAGCRRGGKVVHGNQCGQVVKSASCGSPAQLQPVTYYYPAQSSCSGSSCQSKYPTMQVPNGVLFTPRPVISVIQQSCPGGNCPK